ncbi:MAG: DUF460 domain-containing protein [Nanoarchaeota archaeon]|nr:DUF460 domain-containing protein [Nanoarchaeota archaeon]
MIIGIDPGTTIGYAVLDLDGKLIDSGSKKHMEFSELISRIIRHGKVLLVGCDKAVVPSLVRRAAAKLGAKIISPRSDLKVDEKRVLVDVKTCDMHESDAVASAMFAYNEITPLLKKIDQYVKEYRKEKVKKKISEIVISRGISIKKAAGLLEPREEDIIIKKVKFERKLEEKDFFRLYDKLKLLQKDFTLLKQQNVSLQEQIKQLENRDKFLMNKLVKNNLPQTIEKKLGHKERAIQLGAKEIQAKENELDKLRDELNRTNHFLSLKNSHVLLKKLDNLGSEEFMKKNSLLNIQDKDILLVEDLFIKSDKVIQDLKEKVDVIVYRNKSSKNLPFIMIDAKKLNLTENDYFAVVEKQEFEKQKDGYQIIRKILGI